MNKFLRLIDSINRWTGEIVGPLVIVITGVLVYEVLARYAFNAPTIWAHETSTFLFGALFILGGGYTLLRGGHVNVDLLYNRFGPRTKGVVHMVTSVLFFIFCGVLLWQGIEMSRVSMGMWERAASIWRPYIYPIKLTLPIAAFLLLLQGIAQFARALVAAMGRREPL